MGKPSIFSKDYEKKMRKRRKRIIITSIFVVLILLIGAVSLKLTISKVDMQEVRNSLQAWIDSDKDDTNKDEYASIDSEEKQKEIVEAPKEPEVKTKELKVNDKVILKAEYENIDGEDKFKAIQNLPENYQYDINNKKNMIIVLDNDQNIKLFNINGKEVNITKESYTAPNGEVFNKDTVLKTYDNYLWHKDIKFINNTKVAYISNVPYFGYDLNKYIWMIDLNNNNHITLWNSKSKDITFGNLEEKGLKVNIDGNEKFLNSDGNLIN